MTLLELEAQAQFSHGLQPFYLYEHDAHPEQIMEVQLEAAVLAAAETFLLPELASMATFPRRCEAIGPMGWDVVDPKGEVHPIQVAVTQDGRRFLVGLADWTGPRTMREHWQCLPATMRTEIMTQWTALRQRRRRGH